MSRLTAGTVSSAVVACGEVYRNLKIRSIPPDFLSSFRVSLPEAAVIAGLRAKSKPAWASGERQFLRLLPKNSDLFWLLPAATAVRDRSAVIL